MSDLVEYHNEAIAKSAGNPLTSSLSASLPPAFLPSTSLPPAFLPSAFLPPAFLPPVSLPLAAFKRFNCYCASTSLKR